MSLNFSCYSFNICKKHHLMVLLEVGFSVTTFQLKELNNFKSYKMYFCLRNTRQNLLLWVKSVIMEIQPPQFHVKETNLIFIYGLGMNLLANLCCALGRQTENAPGERNSYLIQNGDVWSQIIYFKGNKTEKQANIR